MDDWAFACTRECEFLTLPNYVMEKIFLRIRTAGRVTGTVLFTLLRVLYALPLWCHKKLDQRSCIDKKGQPGPLLLRFLWLSHTVVGVLHIGLYCFG